MTPDEPVSLRFRQDGEEQNAKTPSEPVFEKHNFGTSSLYGRTERNITFRQRGVHDENKFESAFPRAYLEILRSAFRMVSMFFKK
ncbi:hypothetical protein NNJEOMEG_00055 [Fundidesulfovibrio magnetotacticus]|uniref:Uncharacterized protein n=1 Tax=Fundidesulfovibrio magnetotacticus TaxID=2730080 RepID=A0A6V8LHP9_9BACT|nr:hypothetical protein [Fundidesulfovibrio magnetotacticus]GFK92233.1 hypothetical protein NNJEOMEG_00055 [Fundidesulfovibrio magnetotacticus]